MARVLVTGADGFVGRWLCRSLLAGGHQVIGGARPSSEGPDLPGPWKAWLAPVAWVALDLDEPDVLAAALGHQPDWLIHLAAVASGAEARRDPLRAWHVNAVGTARLVYLLEAQGWTGRLVFASTGEVYGRDLTKPATESDPVAPCSPYAASKAAAEQAVLESARRTGLNAVVARPFAQAGAWQRADFVVSAFADRILAAARTGASSVPVGNLEPTREFLDVRDVAAALILLAERGEREGVYNIASGRGVPLREVFDRIAKRAGWHGVPEADPSLFRPADIDYLVGDGGALRALGWRPHHAFDDTLDAVLAWRREFSS